MVMDRSVLFYDYDGPLHIIGTRPLLPDGLRRLASLVDEHWSSLTQLQVLDLSRNQLRELPPSIGKLASLQHLDITKYATP